MCPLGSKRGNWNSYFFSGVERFASYSWVIFRVSETRVWFTIQHPQTKGNATRYANWNIGIVSMLNENRGKSGLDLLKIFTHICRRMYFRYWKPKLIWPPLYILGTSYWMIHTKVCFSWATGGHRDHHLGVHTIGGWRCCWDYVASKKIDLFEHRGQIHWWSIRMVSLRSLGHAIFRHAQIKNYDNWSLQ